MTTRFPGDDDTDETRPLIPAPVADQIMEEAMRRSNHYPTGTLFVGKDGAWQELGAIDGEGFMAEPEPATRFSRAIPFGIPVVESDLVPDDRVYLFTETSTQDFTVQFEAPAAGDWDAARALLHGPTVAGRPAFALAFETEERIPRPQRPLRPWQPWRQRRYRRDLAAWQRAAQAWEDGNQVRRMRTLIPRAVLS